MANEAVIKQKFNCFPFVKLWSLVLGRLASRLLHYFKECWSECQPITPQIDDDINDFNLRNNPLKKSTIITRDKNNNTKTRKNYRQLAGLSDEDDDNEPEYVPIPSSKRVGYINNSRVERLGEYSARIRFFYKINDLVRLFFEHVHVIE